MQIKTNISPFSFEKETVTCCSPGSLHDLRKKHSNFKLSSKPSKIKISTEFMEVAESSFIQQIQDKDINKELYRKYEEDFRKIIVDNEGNYIYTKVSKDLPKELSNLSIKIDRTLGVQEYTSFIDKKLLELENDKCDIKELNEKPKFFIRKSLKTTDSSTKKRKVPRDFINSLKEGAYQKMNEFINLKNKQDVIQSSKNEITAIVREYTLSIEKLTKENQFLLEDSRKMKLHLEETVELSEFLKRKNMLLIEQLKSLQLKYEEQLNMTSELELFSKGMKALTEKYPNFTIEKLMTRYELLEVTSMSLTKKLSELEDEKQCSDNEKIKQLADFQNKLLFYSEADKRKEKQLQEFNIRINNQKFDKETFSYKEKYFQIFNRIIVLFNKWNTSIRVFYNYNKDDLENENVVLEDPMNILEVMDKMMQISTPQGLQSYLRKIIIAANKLQRNHFKQFVNERFDPEKLFERIDKKMIAMGREKVKTKIFLGNTMEKIFLE